MERMEDYEQFCKSFRSEEEERRKEAELLLFVQDWIIRILGYMEEDTLDYSLKKLMEQKANTMEQHDIRKDALSHIVDNAEIAFRHLEENMREKIIRENVPMPVYKVREINSYGLNWLSRQSGRTIRQKISSAGNSIMAVQRRMSFDTAENRLFLAFAKELQEHLTVKIDYLPEELIRKEEENLRDELSVFLRRPDLEEVGRWENLPPNNTLLSDQNYKKIWHAWNEMKKIDERIRNHTNALGNRLAVIFFLELLVFLQKELRIPQEPVEIDYDEYKVYLCDRKVHCIDSEGKEAELYRKKNCVFGLAENRIKMEFCDNILHFQVNDGEEEAYEVLQETVFDYIPLAAEKLGIKKQENACSQKRKQAEKFEHVIMDLFSLHPGYIGDEQEYKKLPERILQQKYIGNDIDGDEKTYYIPCDNTNAIKMISGVTETYTIPFAVDNGSMNQMKRLMHMMENYIRTDSFAYVFPDAYNELQLSMVHKAAKMVYRSVRNIPLSIGAAFEYQTTDDFVNKFHAGDFLLVLNLIDDEVTFTLLGGECEEEVKKDISEYKGIVWERHPTSTKLFQKEINDKAIDYLVKLGCAKSEKLYKLFGLDGLRDEVEHLSIYFGSEWFQISAEIEKIADNFKLNVTDAVSEFLTKNRSIVKSSKVHIISVVNNLIYKGVLPYMEMSKKSVLDGCKNLLRLEQRTEAPLWHDYLPALAMKLMYGKFDLIKNARIIPKFDKKQQIDIENTFTLPKNCKEYHFNLVQDDNAREMRYEAVIKNPAFPLKNEVECRLIMTYQYGAEDPYELIFVPLDKKSAGFAEAKVGWKRVDLYSFDDLGSPNFPQAATWEELRNYESKKGRTDLLMNLKKGFDMIAGGYIHFNFDSLEKTFHGDYGKVELNIHGSDCIVNWNSSSWQKGTSIPDKMGEVSFLIDINKRKPTKRYRIYNLHDNSRGDTWFKNRKGSYQCISVIEYEGCRQEIALYDSEFDSASSFHTGILDVSFEVIKNKQGQLKAINIHDESRSPYMEKIRYFARGMRTGNLPPWDFASGWFYFSLYKTFSFANNRSLSEKECPMEVQESFSKAINHWISLYTGMQDKILCRRILLGMSLMARDIGQQYYQLAYHAIDLYYEGKIKIADEIGCGLGDLGRTEEKELLVHMMDLLPKEKMVFVLSKALWHNENFVYNVDAEILLDYFSTAVDQICQLEKKYEKYEKNKYKRDKVMNDMSVCMEYILGIFRLRSLHEEVINKNYLSLNNKNMRILYKCLEKIAEIGVPVKSFLKLEITNKGLYEFMPNLVYALLVYITGQSAESEIKISGLDLEDEE